MPEPVPTADPRADLAALTRTSLVVAIVASLLALACAYATVTRTIDAAATSAEQVTVTVQAVGTHRETRGGRRSRHLAEVRHAQVVAEDGRPGRINSDDLQVGERAELWRDEEGQLSADDPSGIGFGSMVLPVLLGIGALLLAAIAVGSFRRTRLRNTDIDAAPRLRLQLDRAKLDADPSRTTEGVLNLPLRVVESSTDKFPAGREGDLVVHRGTSPVDLSQGIPDEWEGRLLHKGLVMKVFAVRRSPGEPWWVTDL
ncbi:hypothetical protein ncot_15695 [Nocardioides sp. JQ2195]|uniref:hypothetical protein n=1 Tax=Nocardioides sp. JQ2195 TaxID=2592334 RepID=UPI00143EDE1D|nr:hypothetical protein [Nocardioides sp. JQ2195]QIX27869.1 hypothetical protein ncot_15695 [Nocardioides sp. JQ2195]